MCPRKITWVHVLRVRTVYLCIICLLVLLSLLSVHVGRADSWIKYTVHATAAVVYDVDGDGVDEVILLPGYVLDNYVLIKSPYPPMPHGLLVDLDWDGSPELVLYNDRGDCLVFKGMRLVHSFVLGKPPATDMERRTLVAGNLVVWKNNTWRVEDAVHLVPVVAGDKVYAVYNNGTHLLIADPSGARQVIYNDNLEPLAAYAQDNKVFILARARTGVVYIVYDMASGAVRMTGYSIPVSRVYAFTGDGFLVEALGKLYRITSRGAVLEYAGKPLYYDGRYIYIRLGGRLAVYDPTLRRTVYSSRIPPSCRVAGSYPTLALVCRDKVLVLSRIPEPFIEIDVPRNVLVGIPVHYRVTVKGATNYTILLDGKPVPPAGRIVFNHTGVHVITVSAANGPVTVTENATIKVHARPIKISLRFLAPPTPYKTTRLVVETRDALRNVRVDTVCRLRIGRTMLLARSWKPVNITIIPGSINDTVIRVDAGCGGDGVYKETWYKTVIPLEPVEPEVHVDYLGGGKVRLALTVPSNNSAVVPGVVQVYVDGRLVADTNPAIFKVSPGRHHVLVIFEPASRQFARTRYGFNIEYYYNVSEIPANRSATILVADRPVTRTVTVRVGGGSESTRTVTVTVRVPTTSTTPDLAACLISGIVGVAGGYLLARRRKTTPREEEEEETLRSRKLGGPTKVEIEKV